MATWKSVPVSVTICDYDDWIECKAHWEYQTTSDVFSYYETVAKPKHSILDRKVGDTPTHIYIGPDTARNLYHALSDWMKSYNSEKDQMEAITDNIFEKERGKLV